MAGLIKVSAILLITAIGIFYANKYFRGGVCKSEARLDGKTVIITGGNTGIGKETAIDLANRGAKIIIACRSRERGEDAVADIKRESGSDDVFLQMLDLSSFKSVRAFAKRILETEERLDVLINNAGVYVCGPNIQKTDDGFEEHLKINHLGHFLLTELLIDLLKKSSPSRIINVSSKVHLWATPDDLYNLENVSFFSNWRNYGFSKLANIVHAKELSRRHSAEGVTAYSLTPGFTNTDIFRGYFVVYPYFSKFIQTMMPVFQVFVKTPKEGAKTTIYVAVSEGIEIHSGGYFQDCEVTAASKFADDKGFTEKLWKFSLDATQP